MGDYFDDFQSAADSDEFSGDEETEEDELAGKGMHIEGDDDDEEEPDLSE